MDIAGYEVTRKLFSNESGLNVFKVVEAETETGETFILRLADFSDKSTDFKKEQWNRLQEEYQNVITDFTQLPRISKISKVDKDRLFTLYDCEEGATLKEKGQLATSEIAQLLAAVRHLHDKGMIHGSISDENVWMTTKGGVILYGAGEAKVLVGQARLGAVSDIRQLVKLIRTNADLSEGVLERLDLENPMNVDELAIILSNTIVRTVVSEDNKLAGFFERKSINMNQKKATASLHQSEKEMISQDKQVLMDRASGKRNLILGVIVVVLLLFLVGYFLM
jgi:serine/threonine protein kinase